MFGTESVSVFSKKEREIGEKREKGKTERSTTHDFTGPCRTVF